MYKPEKGNNYQFIDKQISRMFTMSAPDMYLHKYLGTKAPLIGTADQPIYSTVNETNIQDLLFLENRDRKYSAEVYRIRGIYNVQNIDFNMSQFGLFLDNDTLFLTVHINDFINTIGRKPIAGDVLEFPNLKDDYALNDFDYSLPRYYVIDEIGRASEGFSATWYPHLYRIKLTRISDSQQFADILNKPADPNANFAGDYSSNNIYYPGQIVRYNGVLYVVKSDGSVPNSGTNEVPPNDAVWDLYTGDTIKDILSTNKRELEINNQLLLQAEADAPLSGYETRHFFTLAVDENGSTLTTTENNEIVNQVPVRSGYSGYLVGDGYPANGYLFGSGIQFPSSPNENDFFLRTDFIPNRLFRFDGTKWLNVEDKVRTELTNTNTRNTQKFEFINNTKSTYTGQISSDSVRLIAGQSEFNTSLDYVLAPYVVIKFETYILDYTTSEHSQLITPVTVNNVSKIKITLPIINDQQQTIPYGGIWTVTLYNYKEDERQSVSKALRPKADF